jgi:SUKH-3 immunity protein
VPISLSGPGLALAVSAGWSPGRVADAAADIRRLESVGFRSFACAAEFLDSFLGLRLRHPPSIELGGKTIFCWTEFSPSAVCTERDAQVAWRCSEVIGEPLFPVGTDGFHLTIYVSPSARFYAGVDSYVFEYSGNADDLFGMMAAGVRPRRIGEWSLHP